MPRHPGRKSYESDEDYLMDFFLQTLLLVLKMPDSLIDRLEEAIKLEKERREEVQARLRDLKSKAE